MTKPLEITSRARRRLHWAGLWTFMLIGVLLPVTGTASIHHRLDVSVQGQSGEIAVTDVLDLAVPAVFSLAESFDVTAEGARLVRLGRSLPGIVDYRLEPTGEVPVSLSYRGGVPGGGTDIFDMPRAVIDGQGVFLDASSAWYPLFREATLTFDLTLTLPAGWRPVGQAAVPQSLGGGRFRVVPRQPQEDIYLLAGPYEVYERTGGAHPLAVYLLQPDEALAQNYLDAMEAYIAFYSELVGPYPHEGFAVVENRWQTGYGMPGFTLLGSRVLRLPFLLKTSLPHEILHNWFGNGVYIDAVDGNWSEGLTAYLADYLIAEANGGGAANRQRLLARYADFAASGHDQAVVDFRARHDDASQAVGYDKVQLILHMLRQQIGDDAFIAGVRHFYESHRFRRAAFMDLLRAFTHEGYDPEAFFAAWIARPGAPLVAVGDAVVTESEGSFALQLDLAQLQDGEPFPLQIPIYVTLEGEEAARRVIVTLDQALASFELAFPKRPLRVDIDPAFETFRSLSPLERPSTLGRLFGASRQWLVIPADAPSAVQQAWVEFADAWNSRYGNVVTLLDTETERVPPDDAVWLLGWGNRGLAELGARFDGQGQHLLPDGAEIAGERFERPRHALVLLDVDNARPPLGFIGVEDVTAIRRLAGKLTHYGSFGRMAFELPGLDNLRRDNLDVARSPLSRRFVDDVPELQLPAAPILAAKVEAGLPR